MIYKNILNDCKYAALLIVVICLSSSCESRFKTEGVLAKARIGNKFTQQNDKGETEYYITLLYFVKKSENANKNIEDGQSKTSKNLETMIETIGKIAGQTGDLTTANLRVQSEAVYKELNISQKINIYYLPDEPTNIRRKEWVDSE